MTTNRFNSASITNNPLALGGSVAAGFVALGLLFSSIYTVDEKERGVILRNGAFVGVAEPGLHFKLPVLDSVKFISTQSYTATFERLPAYSNDQQPAFLNISVSWHIDPSQVADLYRAYGSEVNMVGRLINRQAPTQTENTFGRYTALRVVQNRDQFVGDLAAALRTNITGPVTIEGVQVENIDFNDDYEKSIGERMKAEVAVTTRKQQLATEKVQAEIVVTKAQAEADSKLAMAKAEADAIRLRGDAEAEAIRARADALASNSNLVELTKAERWDGKLPATMLPNAAVPFIEANRR